MLLSTLLHPHSGSAQTTAFTYQGFLTENGGPANTASDFEFKLYNAASAGTQQGSTVTLGDVGVTNGLFTVSLDFGASVFDGSGRWLDIAVRPGASAAAYTNLVPRQPITATPYAIRAASATAVTMGAITDPSFIGTTTTAPLQLQVSNTVGLRLEYPTAGTVPNLVGGFSGNSVGAGTEGAVIGGGGSSGGNENTIGTNSSYSSIGGGQNNTVASNAPYATIAGGVNNDIGVESQGSAIGGGQDNTIAPFAFYATIAGGYLNNVGANSIYSAIGGGLGNTIAFNSVSATIAGGWENGIGVSSDSSAIGGGNQNTIASNTPFATIAGGRENGIGAGAIYGAIGGGWDNGIGVNADFSAIGGGRQNSIGINSENSMIPGGKLNSVGANAGFAFAAGYRAKANHYGSFVWADFTEADFATTGANQFAIRAGGGVRVEGGTDASPSGGGFLTLGAESALNLVLDNNEIMARNNGAVATLALNNNGGDVTIGNAGTSRLGIGRTPAANELEVEGTASKTASGSWLANSDARIKQEVQPVTSALETLGKVRLVSFRYTDDYLAQHQTIEDRRYLNVIAQEFAEVFPEHVKSSGEKLPDGSEILQVDIHPLTIYSAAAVQELNRKLTAELNHKNTEITELKQKNAEMETRLNALEKLMKRLSVVQNGGGE